MEISDVSALRGTWEIETAAAPRGKHRFVVQLILIRTTTSEAWRKQA